MIAEFRNCHDLANASFLTCRNALLQLWKELATALEMMNTTSARVVAVSKDLDAAAIKYCDLLSSVEQHMTFAYK